MLTSKHQNTRQEILLAALRLMAERSYNAVSMRDIANVVGIRQSAIYNHFSSKQVLLVELMTAHLEAVIAAARNALADVSGPVARLETFARFHVDYHVEHPDDVFIAYMELRSLEEDGLVKVNRLRGAYEDILRSILSEGITAGLFKIADAAVHTRALLAMLTGITVWYREGGQLDRVTVIDYYTQAAIQSVGLPFSQGGES